MATSPISKRKQDSSKANFSRYVQGGVVENFNNRLGWWERGIIEPAADDIQYTVRSEESGRADIIAFRFYQRTNMAWLVLQFNNIVDPVVELKAGVVINLPTPTRAMLSITTIPV